MHNVILIGFMGCGKSSVGIRLSYLLKRPLEDTDKLIERQQQRSVKEIFATYGEEAFRRMETECLMRLLSLPDNKIISVGGGMAVQPDHTALLKQLGTVIYLKASAGTVWGRLREDTSRPLLQTERPEQRIRELMREREPFYEAAADITVETDELTLDEAAEHILRALEKMPGGGGAWTQEPGQSRF